MVIGIPVIAILLANGWRIVKPKVVENTGNRLAAVRSDDGPTFGDDVTPDDLEPEKAG